MTDAAYYEAPQHIWGPLWRFASEPGVSYILTPTGRMLRPHIWALWYVYYKREHQRWFRRKHKHRRTD